MKDIRMTVVLTLLLLLVLVGCAKPKVEQTVKLGGAVKTIGDLVVLSGNSNLPKGAVVQIVMKEIEGGKQVLEEKVNVGEDGSYSWSAKRPERAKEYELDVMFLPELQPKHVKEKYGEKGELIKKDSSGRVEYQTDGQTYVGIKMYDRILKIGDGMGGQQSMLAETLPPPAPSY
ncbi:hypothetical protein ABS784_14565 [Geobacillus sp. G4]|mgnify:CR=1 FL=1|jgi:hypothetical protein|uniref:Lipoprotein n=8 Tax=Geobacillus TaxID=129337 RepID=Q5L3L9_GEOKA|nr:MULTISPECIES: hypothetical protein [Geobacillus]KZM58584.1 hypothetical protein A3Q36_14920 [Geobacillus stearothermophilus]AEV17502.1 hypothetical protein GTCCBUS3UF5_1730 [Geobacillus thermoleovorans CCB_US3_UF5]ARA98013.1 hypothetical protein GD3902_08110 [Geobacillus thermodenitrificans]ARP41186.1 hypothetical protein GTHT12_03244 [Geobacillus thermodenitrificans]ATO37367.1 hypothetical protein GTID1_09180 [Geobacillus thermodenitrificans]